MLAHKLQPLTVNLCAARGAFWAINRTTIGLLLITLLVPDENDECFDLPCLSNYDAISFLIQSRFLIHANEAEILKSFVINLLQDSKVVPNRLVISGLQVFHFRWGVSDRGVMCLF